jgi:di/tricarboxylate transporter
MPSLPSAHATAALGVTIVVFAMFASGRIRIELVCLGTIAVLALGFYLFPLDGGGRLTGMEVAFGGFGHEALVAICCLMILGRGLVVTGALDPAAHALVRVWRFNRASGMLCSLLVCAGLSMLVNDTPVVVLALPILLALASRADVPASKTLMPVNCAILIGGMGTTIGTSTNLLVVSIAADLGLPRLGVFSFTTVALTAGAIALPYLWLIMPRLLPSRTPDETEAPRRYDAALEVPAATKTPRLLTELRRKLGKVAVSGIARRGFRSQPADDPTQLEEGDQLLVSGTANELHDAATAVGGTLAAPAILREAQTAAKASGEDERLAHIIVGGDSSLIGKSVKSARIAEQYGIAVLGVSRSTTTFGHKRSPAVERLDVGDVLLARGAPSRLKAFEVGEGVHLLDGGKELARTAKAAWALLIVASVVVVATAKILPVAIAALAGTIAMLAVGCIKFSGVGRALSLEVIVLVAASIALSRALTETGAADWLGTLFAAGLKFLPPAAVLAALMVFVTALTNFVSNAAAAGIGTPLAMSLAAELGINPEPLVLAVLFGCNICYVTPMAYQTNLLIMGAARYEFRDFLRAGLPLAVLMIVTLAYLLVRRYEL